MEQDTEYQKANQKIKELQQYYERLSQSELPKAQSKAHKDIGTHFEICFKALEARKTSLLRQVDLDLEHQMKEERERVKQIMDGYTKLINSSNNLYKLNPELSKTVWKGIYICDNSQKQSIIPYAGNLQETLFNVIEVAKFCKSNQQEAYLHAGMISTLAGSSLGYQDGIGANVQMEFPIGIVMNPTNGQFYFCDYGNGAIRQATTKGEVVPFAKVESPGSITWYQKENCFFVTSGNHTISKVSVTGKVTLVAGTKGQSGNNDGANASARFNYPQGITIDQQTGNIYVCDQENNLIRKIIPQGDVSTLAGTCGSDGHDDGSGSSAKFCGPEGITFFEKQQCLVICDIGNDKLRRVNLDGEVSTICEIPNPNSIAIINNTSFLVSSDNFKIFKVTHQDLKKESVCVEEFAGTGEEGNKDGPPSKCTIGSVYGMAFDPSASACYLADFCASSIRKLELLK